MSNSPHFIDAFTAFAMGIGLPRSTARVLSFLLICEPREQTTDQLREQLGLSSGSTSIATSMLVDMQLAEVVRKPGERKHYYRLVPNGFEKLTLKRIETFKLAKGVADMGLNLDPRNDRLIAIRELYAFLDREMQDVMARYKPNNS